MSFTDLITHIIIEDTNRKAIQAAKAKETAVKANLVEDKMTTGMGRYVT